VLLPACLMLMAGAFYWVRVRLTAEQLLPGALHDYLRQQADLDVQVGRIQLGWTQLQAWNLRVHLPDGTELGDTRYLALAWQQYPIQQLQIRLERPRLLLKRDAHGRWNIEPFLKRPPRRAAVQIPLELVSTDGVLEFRDEFIRPQVAQTMRLQRVLVRQPGSSMIVRAWGSAPSVGTLNLDALSDGDRWRMNLSVDRLRWATVAPYLSAVLAKGEWQIADGASALQMNLFYAPHQPLRIEGTAQGALYEPRYAQTPLPWREIRFETRFSNSFLVARLNTPDGQLRVSGAMERTERGEGLRYALILRLHGEDARVIERIARRVIGGATSAATFPTASVSPMRQYTLQLQASGRWTSRKGWRDLLTRARAAGYAELEQLRTAEGILHQIRVPFLLVDGQLHIRDARAGFADGICRANASIDLTRQAPRILLTALAQNVQLEQIPTLRHVRLSGRANVQLLSEGTLQQPRLLANLISDELRYDGSRLGAVRARLMYQRDTLQIPLAMLQGAIGSMQITGSVHSLLTARSPSLTFQFSADEVDLNRLASLLGYREGILGYWEPEAGQNKALRLDGIAYVRGSLRGTVEKPLLQAQAAVFNGRLGDIGVELLAMQAAFQQGRLLLPEITLYRRTAVAHASGEMELASFSPRQKPRSSTSEGVRFRLQGNIADFDLATLAEWGEPPLKLAGLANLSFIATGTPDQFEIRGELTTHKAQLDLLTIDSTSAQFQLTRRRDTTELRVDSARVQLREGTVQGQARLNLNGEEGQLYAEWRAQSVPLLLLAPYLPPEYRLRGLLDAEGQVQGAFDALQAEVTWRLAQLNLNDVLLGEASGIARWAPENTLLLQAQLNAPDGRIQIDTLRYTPEHGAIEAQGVIEAIPVDWVRHLALALPMELPPAIVARTDTLNGTLDTTWHLSGTTEQPQLAFEGRATQLALNGQALGELQMQGNWSQQQFDWQLRWQAEAFRLEARGNLQQDALTAEMELSRFPLEWVQLWEPRLPPVKGQLDLTALVRGNPKHPELTLSAIVQNLTLPLDASLPDRREFTIDQLLFSRVDVREGAITTDDALIQVRGYWAHLSGQLPFHWSPPDIPRDEPLSVQLTLREQSLRLLELFLPIDAERTHGTLNAQLMVDGTLNALQPRGALQIAEGSLAFETLSTYLQNIGLQVEFDGQRARVMQAQASSSAGGQLRLKGEIEVAREEPTLALTATLEQFTVNEPHLPIGGSAFGRINGEVALQGTFKQPQLIARLQVQDGFLHLPAEIQATPAEVAFPLNPALDVEMQFARGFTLRNPNLDARMEGSLRLAGSLNDPRASGTFSLQGGAMRLPTARLRLEPESLILLSYPHLTPDGEKIARLDLNVRATTTVVALDYTGNPQRYRVELDIHGPLDDPQRFQMVARSDPPGLSEQHILSLLGRGGALEALVRGGDPVQIFRQQLSEMVTGQVLPGLLSPLETGIAEALGLEQFALDYTGGVAPTSLYLVKELFNGFGISYRRSLTLANPQYEVRLFYRLPFRNRFLQRLKFGWGFDNAQRQFLFIEGSMLFR